MMNIAMGPAVSGIVTVARHTAAAVGASVGVAFKCYTMYHTGKRIDAALQRHAEKMIEARRARLFKRDQLAAAQAAPAPTPAADTTEQSFWVRYQTPAR